MSRRRVWVVLLVFAALAVAFVASCADGGDARVGESEGTSFVARSDADFVGSQRCGECHDKVFATWAGTLHAQIMQEVSDNPQAILGDFASKSTTRTFSESDVVITHGVQWKQRYIDSEWHILPAQWNLDAETWAPYKAKDWKESDWRQECAYCHVVGFDNKNNEWTEFGIGCEACHGPGSAHADGPNIDNIYNPARMPRAISGDVCAQCHTRGKSPSGKEDHPVGFKVGDQLLPSYFTPVPLDDSEAWWPDGAAKMHRQQGIEWRQSIHFRGGVDCADCHEVHRQSGSAGSTRLAGNTLCRECHPDTSTDPVLGHAPIAGAPQHSDCVECHMPRTAKSADFGDEHDHRFQFIAPSVTIELGDGDPGKQPNSCNSCKQHVNDSPERLQKALDDGLAQLSER